jgi:hypothetical protein
MKGQMLDPVCADHPHAPRTITPPTLAARLSKASDI